MNTPGEHKSNRPLTPDEAGLVIAQVSALTSSGLPLASGLLATAEEMPRGRVRSTLRNLSHAIEGGASLEEAIGGEHGRLPKHLQGVMLIGARTGRTTEVLGRFLGFMNVGSDLRRKLWIRLLYPAFCLLVALALLVFLLSTLGVFRTIFLDFGIPLPWFTQVLLAVAGLFQIDATLAFEAVLACLVCFVSVRLLMSEKLLRSLLASIPIFGGVWRNSGLAEFCHLLALLLESALPLGEALRLTGSGVNDTAIDQACQAMAGDVEGGLLLSQAMTRRPVFPIGMGRVLRWAEKHQSLPESLHTTGEMFEARARAQAGLAGTILAIVALVLILTTVAAAIFGIMVPLITLISKLSG